MDSDQDISMELERLNAQLAELAAAEDINLSICDNSTASCDGATSSGPGNELNTTSQLISSNKSATPSKRQPDIAQASLGQLLQQSSQQRSPAKHKQAISSAQQQDKQRDTLRASRSAVQALERLRSSTTQKLQALPMNTESYPAPVLAVSAEQSTPHSLQLLTDVQQHQPQDLTRSQQQQDLVQQLLQQHGKLLDLLQILATNYSKDRTTRRLQRQLSAEMSELGVSSSIAADDARYIALQEQYQSQLMDNHQLKKRLSKVQKVLLQHLQEARLKAAAAEAACEGAQRKEQDAISTAAGLQVQVMQQQQDLQRQQLELSNMRDQLQQVKDLHKQKLAQVKAELQQHYNAQLQATTAAYAHELAQIQAHLAGSRRKHSRSSSSKHAGSVDITAVDHQQGLSDADTAWQLATAAVTAAVAGKSAVPNSRDNRSMKQPAAAAIVPDFNAIRAAMADARPTTAGTGVSKPATARAANHSAFAGLQQEQHGQHQQPGGGQELHVPEEVVQYAERYQQGGEGTCRPLSAAPSVLQRKRQQEQPVPEAAAQLAQHFVAGGEGISRPLTAPSSDRSHLSRHSGSSPPRSSRPSARSSMELLLPTNSASVVSSCIPSPTDVFGGAADGCGVRQQYDGVPGPTLAEEDSWGGVGLCT